MGTPTGSGNDLIRTDGDNDTIQAGDGNNEIHAGKGNNIITAGSGHDEIWANGGDDVINAGNGNNIIRAGNDSIDGGSGSDILVGGDGNDFVWGQSGRDLVIGGRGTDRLYGNQDDDILIGGWTSFDTDRLSLNAIMREWASPRSYSDRVKNLSGNSQSATYSARENGNVFLRGDVSPSQTVFDDSEVDVISGNQASDWFFANLAGGVLDILDDRNSSENQNDIN